MFAWWRHKLELLLSNTFLLFIIRPTFMCLSPARQTELDDKSAASVRLTAALGALFARYDRFGSSLGLNLNSSSLSLSLWQLLCHCRPLTVASISFEYYWQHFRALNGDDNNNYIFFSPSWISRARRQCLSCIFALLLFAPDDDDDDEYLAGSNLSNLRLNLWLSWRQMHFV